jgi:thioredoxin reductase
MTDLPRVCIIGAGCSGIAAAKAFHEAGIPFDCFEKSDRVGGNWVFGNKNGMSSAYRSLHINTSRDRMQYSDFPMPREYPHFPHHSQVAAYFDAYVDHFGFRDRIAFETGVARAARGDYGTWEVELDTGETRHYDALAVCNGHHWDARWPDPPFAGSFDGVQMHAHHYVDPAPFAGKNVVVLGMGNSAMDIAVEVSDVANRTFLAARRGAYVVPKYLFGRPLDQFATQAWLPWPVRRTMFQLLLRLAVGSVEYYGLPKPDHRFGEAHPTISGLILDRIGHGCVLPQPNIAELAGDRVRFADGTVEPVDAIVYCTGYNVTFPFFDPAFLAAPNNELPLFHRVFKPGFDNVFFIGLLQPLGAIMPLAELQSRWVAEYLAGRYALPDRTSMERVIAAESARMRRRYVASARHTMQVDFDDYIVAVRREMRRGSRRAVRSGGVVPVDPKAEGVVVARSGR